MSKVSYQEIKKRMNEKRSKITDRQFFTSRLLSNYFEDLAMAQTRRYQYNRRIKVRIIWEEDNKHSASTDNRRILINAGHPSVTKVAGRANRYQFVCGLFAHELGHILYTDFPMKRTYLNRMKDKQWYPEKPKLNSPIEEDNEKALWDYVSESEENLLAVQIVASELNNVLEDGYIENRILNQYPGTLGFGLEKMRESDFLAMPTVTQMIEIEAQGKLHILRSIMQIMLSYVKFGEIKYGDTPLTDERIQAVFGLLTALDDGVFSKNGKARWATVNQILVRLWDYVKDFCEQSKQEQKQNSASGTGQTLEEVISKALKPTVGGSQIGNSLFVPIVANENGIEEENANTQSSRSESKTFMEQPQTEEPTEESEKGTESSRIPYHETEEISTDGDGSFERNNEYRQACAENAASDINRLLEGISEEEVFREMEDERTQALNDYAQTISYGNAHKDVNIRVNRMSEIDESLIEGYNNLSGELLHISRQLQKSITHQIKDTRQGAKQTNLLIGRRLNANALHRNDGRVFYKNNIPRETELAVAVLIDESGSMIGDGRIVSARATAIILHDFCSSLGIPIMIYGHSTGTMNSKSCVELYSYAEYETVDNNDKYRLMGITNRNCNRDGAALRYIAERLCERSETTKLLILISDGQPYHTKYSGSEAEKDLRSIKEEYKRKGVIFVAAAIGDDKDCIERIYGNSFLDITDLNKLPTNLAEIIKRHIRV